MNNHIQIKQATIEDVKLIREFIVNLAEYEGLLHEVSVTEEDLKNNIFNEKSNIEVIFAYYNNIPVGFCLYFYNFSTFKGKPGLYIEDLFVNTEYRGKGIGKALFNHLEQLAKSKNCGRLEWLVLDWNEKAIDFYQSRNAKIREDYRVFRLESEDIK